MCFEHIEVLTVLPSVPEAAGSQVMRPAYFGADKRMVSLSQVNFDLLPTLTPPTRPSGIPTVVNWDDALTTLEAVKPDWAYGYAGIESFAPSANYGTRNGYLAYSMGAIYQNAYQVLFAASGSNIAKRDLLRIHFLQYGLDLYGILKYGAGKNHTYGGSWPAKGGYGTGRYAPILYAAALVSDSENRKALLADRLSTNLKKQSFAETNQITRGQTQMVYGAISVPGGVTYTSSSNNMIIADPNGLRDGFGSSCPAPYQSITFPSFWAQASFIRMVPEMRSIAFSGLLEYVDRMITDGPVPCGTRIYGICTSGPDAGRVCRNANSDCGGGGTCSRPSANFREEEYLSWPAMNSWFAFDGCYANSSCSGMSGGGDSGPSTTVPASPVQILP